jgi:hemerythrin
MLKFISWTDDYSVRIQKIDDQHKNLISMAKDLQKAYEKGIAGYVLESILKDLIEYTKSHFETEEELMEKYSFPELEEHKREHDILANKVFALQKEFHEKKSTETIYVSLDFLSSWIHQHLLKTDHKYSQFLVDKGVR